jgi:predicted PurR-regulated permease PerM
MLPPMRLNPYLLGLRWLSLTLIVVGIIMFIVSLVLGLSDAAVAGVMAGVAGLLFPLGLLSFILWIAVAAIVWTPADEPARVTKS